MSNNEGCPSNWVNLNLMVSPTGEYHAIGGDRAEGEGDQPYVGMERLRVSSESACYKPLSGEWRHGGGYLINGTLRIAKADFDTNPDCKIQNEIFDWMVEALNKAQGL